MAEAGAEHPKSKLILVAMIFACGLTFIDQTIVSIAVPELQKDLGLSSTGVQWVVNGYLLALAALFAFGGRISDIVGHRTMLIVGVVIFTVASALCGATPDGELAEAWIITFRVIEGAGAALLFPAALAIVIASFPVGQRGKAMALFFAITGGLTAIGPLAGGYLIEIDWRAIFWVNVPIAIIALILTWMAKPPNDPRPAPIDYRGLVLVTGGMALAVLGLQQSTTWGWDDPRTIGSIAIGVLLLIGFVLVELRTTESPLIDMNIFRDRGFAADNGVLFLMNMCFLPMFFFASTYAQLALGDSASEAGLYLLTFFGGFAIASQKGGQMLDSIGVRKPVIIGSAIAAGGFYLWAQQLTDLSFDQQWYYVVMTGVGMGLILSPASTDGLNRAPSTSYGEATGIEQTVRNFGASLGLAILGSLLISQNTSNIEDKLEAQGISTSEADSIASAVNSAGEGDSSSFSSAGGKQAESIFEDIQAAYAQSSETVFTVMAGIMVVCLVFALFGVPRGKPDHLDSTENP
jgi:EmrB/QacA subfamily drug resistance transporter